MKRNSDVSTGTSNRASHLRRTQSRQSQLSSLGPLPDTSSVGRMFQGLRAPKSRGQSDESCGAMCATQSNQQKKKGSPSSANVLADEGPSPYSCAICSTVFSSPHALKAHNLEMHEGKNVVRCPHCECVFTRTAQLGRHIEVRNETFFSFLRQRLSLKYASFDLFFLSLQTYTSISLSSSTYYTCLYLTNDNPQTFHFLMNMFREFTTSVPESTTATNVLSRIVILKSLQNIVGYTEGVAFVGMSLTIYQGMNLLAPIETKSVKHTSTHHDDLEI